MIEAGDTTAEGNDEEKIGSDDVNLAEEVAKWQDKYVRLSAEFDNFRKRTLKEKMELIESASEDVLKSVLVIMDDMDRAIEANQKAEDIEVVRKGSELIHKKLCDLLKSKGVKEIDAMGGELDTDLHEAIAKFPTTEEEKKGKIIDVVEKGYKLKDKVIRYAKVVVGE
ncbi:MAG: nucleotide exchange factor GrpE [Rikenellaceae bacterium]